MQSPALAMYTFCTNFAFAINQCTRGDTKTLNEAQEIYCNDLRNPDPRAAQNLQLTASRKEIAAGGAPRHVGKGSKGPRPEIKALDGIDLDVAPGQIFGLLGPNAAQGSRPRLAF